MPGMSSRAVNSTVVYAQATQPSVQQDGVLWVDTSKDSRPVFVYSTDTDGFEPVSPSNISVQDTAPDSPTLGDGWIDTSQDPPVLKVYDGAGWSFPTPPSTQQASKPGGYVSYTVDHETSEKVNRITDEIQMQSSGSGDVNYNIYEGGNLIESGTVPGGDQITEYFSDRWVSEIEYTGGTDSGYNLEAEVHTIALPQHSHDI